MGEIIEINKKEIIHNIINLRQLVFEVTDACNLKCKYCGYSDLYEGYDKRENLSFPFHRAKLIIDYLYGYWKMNFCEGIQKTVLVSFYGGEPLLNVPFIQEVISYIEGLPYVGRFFRYSMTTNAMLLDRYMDFLVTNKFQLLISLDGDEKGQSYRVDLRGNNSFKRVYGNILLLRERYPDFFLTNVNFNSVLHNRNDIASIYSFIKGEFGKEPMLSPLNDSGIRKDKRNEFERTYRSISDNLKQSSNCEVLEKEMFIRAPQAARLMDYIRTYSGNVYGNYSKLLIDKEKLLYHPTGTCVPFSKKMFVTVKGKILQCEKINHEFALGVVTDDQVLLDLNYVVEQHNKYTWKYMRQCEKCSIKYHCTNCVYQIDDIKEENIKCPFIKTQKYIDEQEALALSYLGKHPELYKRILNEVIIRG